MCDLLFYFASVFILLGNSSGQFLGFPFGLGGFPFGGFGGFESFGVPFFDPLGDGIYGGPYGPAYAGANGLYGKPGNGDAYDSAYSGGETKNGTTTRGANATSAANETVAGSAASIPGIASAASANSSATVLGSPTVAASVATTAASAVNASNVSIRPEVLQAVIASLVATVAPVPANNLAQAPPPG